MNNAKNSKDGTAGNQSLVWHWIRMAYGRSCHALWLRLPKPIAMYSQIGAHALGWGGYWANMTWMPNAKHIDRHE